MIKVPQEITKIGGKRVCSGSAAWQIGPYNETSLNDSVTQGWDFCNKVSKCHLAHWRQSSFLENNTILCCFPQRTLIQIPMIDR